ncbi:hypothetical protein F5884DRAFT_763176 [Xylogone sp. PMI_703]|nr:hypothetical protein F5884DRAFT_763176 [Xylogone sp. PMI_703]
MEENLRSRACFQCAIMKVKCVSTDGSKCERCNQLGKECTEQAVVPRKRRAAPASAERIAALEQKLDALANAFASSQRVSWDTPQPSPASILVSSNPHNQVVHGESFQVSGTATAPLLNQIPANSESLDFHLENNEAENLLSLFRHRIMNYFPFITIPNDIYPKQIQQESPVLWKVIVMLTIKNNRWRAELGKSIMNELVNSLLLQGKKNLDLLQSIILFTAWNHHQFIINPQMTNLTHLAKALVTNMHLDRAPSSPSPRKIFMENSISAPDPDHALNRRSSQELRSYLGCMYLISAKCMTGAMGLNAFENTAYVEDCCRLLMERSEDLSDSLLVYLIQLQGIIERIVLILPRDTRQANLKAPVSMIVKSKEDELKAFKSSLSDEMKQNTVLLMHFHAAEVYLYEIGLYDAPFRQEYKSDNTRQIETLYSCVMSVKSYFDAYHRLPMSDYAYLPFTIWIQSGLVLLTSAKLALFEHSAWDVTHVRSILNVPELINYEIRCIEEVIEQQPCDQDIPQQRDIFKGFLERMRKLKFEYESRVTDELALPDSTTELYNQDLDHQSDFSFSFWDTWQHFTPGPFEGV